MKVIDLFSVAADLLALRLKNGELPESVSDLKQRSINLSDLLVRENLFLNSKITGEPYTPDKHADFTSLYDDVPLCSELAYGVLPYGLAALLISDEDKPVCEFFYALYRQKQKYAAVHFASRVHPVKEVY